MYRNVKRWLLSQPIFGEADYKWCKGLKVEVVVHSEEPNEYGYGAQRIYVQGRRDIFLITTTAKQEEMLLLKYGNDLVLHTSMILDDLTTYEDDYGVLSLRRWGAEPTLLIQNPPKKTKP